MNYLKRIRSSVVCVYNNHLLTFKAVDPISGKTYVFIPGGAIEKNESPLTAAERETHEETGYRIKVEPKSEIIKHYPFFWNGQTYDCTTYFYKGFLAEPFHEPGPIADADYHKGVLWLPLQEASELFKYNNEIKDAVLKLVEHF